MECVIELTKLAQDKEGSILMNFDTGAQHAKLGFSYNESGPRYCEIFGPC